MCKNGTRSICILMVSAAFLISTTFSFPLRKLQCTHSAQRFKCSVQYTTQSIFFAFEKKNEKQNVDATTY